MIQPPVSSRLLQAFSRAVPSLRFVRPDAAPQTERREPTRESIFRSIAGVRPARSFTTANYFPI